MAVSKERLERAIIALYDYASRDGATTKGVLTAMKQAGFTHAEISAASKAM